MKKILLLASIIALSPFNLIAQTDAGLTKVELNKKNKELLTKAGINILDSSEIRIIPSNIILNNNNSSQDKNNAYYAEKTKLYLSMHEEQEKNGYVKAIEPRAKELMELKNTALYHQKKYKGVLSPISTHLRGEISELKMAYTFVGVPQIEIDHKIGIAPFGAYKQVKNGDDGDGWDGAVQFFDKNGIGVCAYTEHNRNLAHSGVELIKELTSFDVNEKPTTVLIKGTNETGFIYKLQWYDITFSRELECANPAYNQELRNQVIELAKRIDLSN
jgi:hypothetical protein